MRPRILEPAVLAALVLAGGVAPAHQQELELAGDKVALKAGDGPAGRIFFFKASDAPQISAPITDPSAHGARLVVRDTAPGGASTGVIDLDASRWIGLGEPAGSAGYLYRDPSLSRGGVKRLLIRTGRNGRGGSLAIKAKGDGFPWPDGRVPASLAVHLAIEQEWYCSSFGGRRIRSPLQSSYLAKDAPPPQDCDLCGNGEVEPGEECDDGNTDDNDGCTADCRVSSCGADSFASTFEAIESVVFEDAGCTQSFCHVAGGLNAGGLDLAPDVAFDNLVSVPATWNGGALDRVEPGEPDLSLLYLKLLSAIDPDAVTIDVGSPMPVGGSIAPEHLEAIARWIRGGAPRDRVVEGTQDLLAACLPPSDPLKIPPPEPPAPGTGVQLQQTAWDLPAHSENEICMATYYDFTGTGLVPQDAQFDCSLEGVQVGVNNPSGKCFKYHKQTLLQDPQSHHSLIDFYAGDYAVTDPDANFGPFTYKLNDLDHPDNGLACDPTDVDPQTGLHDGCSGAVQRAAACIGYGPPDLRNASRRFSGSQEPFVEQEYADGVYAVLPMQGVIVWNSHAFNLTDEDTTMAQYLNIEAAAPADQQFPLRGIFHVGNGVAGGFPLDMSVPPFQTLEVCRTFTVPQGARVFQLSSHTHRFGVRFRIWDPPNTPCQPGEPACVPPAGRSPIYFSTEYTDPQQLELEPPRLFDSAAEEDRTLLYCSLYDNGSAASSPEVKRQSTSPVPPLQIPGVTGGPCADDVVACLDGPNQGRLCGGDDSLCPESVCDACPVRSGLTTEDEMFILLGSYYVQP